MKIGNIHTKIITYLIIAAMLIGVIPAEPAKVSAAKRPSVQASAYVVIDASTGKTIYSKKAGKRIYPASTAKLMTALVTLEHLKLNKKITMTKNIKNKVPGDASALSLKNGTRYTVEQYLNMMLIASDACSAVTLAVAASGSIRGFCKLMNKKAKKLGMKHSYFDNPMGLDRGNGYNKIHTTAADMGKLAKAAMKNKVIRKIVKKSKYKVPKVKGAKSFTIKSTNRLYSCYKFKSNKYKVIGTKTGTTNAAGHVLIATVKNSEGNEVIICYFGAKTTDALYTGIKKLFKYTFKNNKFENEAAPTATPKSTATVTPMTM